MKNLEESLDLKEKAIEELKANEKVGQELKIQKNLQRSCIYVF